MIEWYIQFKYGKMESLFWRLTESRCFFIPHLKLWTSFFAGICIFSNTACQINKHVPFRAKRNSGDSYWDSVACFHQPHKSKETFHRSKASLPSANHKLHSAPWGSGSFSCMCIQHAQTRNNLVPQQAAGNSHQERGVSLRWDDEHRHSDHSGRFLWARRAVHLQSG